MPTVDGTVGWFHSKNLFSYKNWCVIYKLLLPFCKKAYVTKIYNSYDADRYMENVDISEEWEEKIKEEIRENDNGIKYQYITYEKKSGY